MLVINLRDDDDDSLLELSGKYELYNSQKALIPNIYGGIPVAE